jgi:hypothetical protein
MDARVQPGLTESQAPPKIKNPAGKTAGLSQIKQT